MIGQGVAVMGVANPLVSEALRASRVRKFSGKAEDFEDFEREWQFHLKLMHGASQGELPDAVVLITLKNYLDDASAALLAGKMAMDSELSYYEFWDSLKSQFHRDARAVHRQNWRAVKLETSGTKTTLQEWSKFQAVYSAKRALVEDWADAEDQQHIFSQIPSEFQGKVLNETQKRRKDKKWVRVVIPPGMTITELIREIENDLGFSLVVNSQEKRHFVVACRSDFELSRLLELDNSKIDRHIIRVQRAEYSMGGDELFGFVRRLLEADEELNTLRKMYGCEVPSRVHAVQASSPRSVSSVPQVTHSSSPPKKHSSGKGNGKSGAGGKGGYKQSPRPATPAAAPDAGDRSPRRSASGHDHPGPCCYDCRSAGKGCQHSHMGCDFSNAAKAARAQRHAAAKDSSSPAAAPSQTKPRSE